MAVAGVNDRGFQSEDVEAAVPDWTTATGGEPGPSGRPRRNRRGSRSILHRGKKVGALEPQCGILRRLFDQAVKASEFFLWLLPSATFRRGGKWSVVELSLCAGDEVPFPSAASGLSDTRFIAAMRYLILMTCLALASCDSSRESSFSGGTAGASPGRASRAPGESSTKARARGRAEKRPDRRGLQKIERTLKVSDHEAALLAFQELLDGSLAATAEEMKNWQAELRGDESAAARAVELHCRSEVAEAQIAEARVMLRDHGADQSKVDAAFLEFQSAESGVAAAQELEALEAAR